MQVGVSSLRDAAEDLMRRRHLPEAVETFQIHLARQPDDLKALLELGICHLLNGSEEAFLAIHDKADGVIRAAGELPEAIVKLWRQYRSLVLKVTAAALVLGSVAAEAYGSGSAHRYSGGVYRPPRPVPVKPKPPDQAARPRRPKTIDTATSASYTWGHWSYTFRTLLLGTRDERRDGLLVYKRRAVPPAKHLDRIWTPWGVMQCFRRDRREAGWLPSRAGNKPLDLKAGRMAPTPVRQFEAPAPAGKPLTKPTGRKPVEPGRIDTKRSGRWRWDEWQYDYRVTDAGKADETRLGRLSCRGRPVPAAKVGDRLWTPWGVAQYFGSTGAARGWLMTAPGDKPLPPTRRRLLPSPLYRPVKPVPLSGHKYSGGVFRKMRSGPGDAQPSG